MAEVLFAIVAACTGGAALGVVLSKSVVRASVWLLFTLIGVSLTYFLLGAEFLGSAQLIVYVGGTLVLVVFGVMLTSPGPFSGFRPKAGEWAIGITIAVALFTLLVAGSLGIVNPTSGTQELPSTGPLGMSFLGIPEANRPNGAAFLLPFEIVSVHLLVVLIAAAYLARAKRRLPPTPGTGGTP